MANKNDGDNTPTQEAKKKYKYELCKEKVACSSEKTSRQQDFTKVKEDEQYRICELIKAEETQKIYQNIDYTVGVGALKEAELVKNTLKEVEEQNKTLVKNLQDAVKQIKDTKNKMATALEVVCKLDRCIEEEERCNIDIYNELNELEGFWDELDAVKNATNSAYQKANAAFDAVVDISGIQTFANLEGLKEYNDDMATAIGNFKGDLQVNLESSAGLMKTVSENFTLVLQELSLARYEESKTISTCEGKDKTYDFLGSTCDPPVEAIQRIREACAKVVNSNIDDSFAPENCEEEEMSMSTNPSGVK